MRRHEKQLIKILWVTFLVLASAFSTAARAQNSPEQTIKIKLLKKGPGYSLQQAGYPFTLTPKLEHAKGSKLGQRITPEESRKLTDRYLDLPASVLQNRDVKADHQAYVEFIVAENKFYGALPISALSTHSDTYEIGEKNSGSKVQKGSGNTITAPVVSSDQSFWLKFQWELFGIGVILLVIAAVIIVRRKNKLNDQEDQTEEKVKPDKESHETYSLIPRYIRQAFRKNKAGPEKDKVNLADLDEKIPRPELNQNKKAS